jgi:hypothetical protein
MCKLAKELKGQDPVSNHPSHYIKLTGFIKIYNRFAQLAAGQTAKV